MNDKASNKRRGREAGDGISGGGEAKSPAVFIFANAE